MQRTIIKNAHVISPDVDLANATIVIEGKRIKEVNGGTMTIPPLGVALRQM